MSMNLVNLDERTRSFMIKELDYDISMGRLYISPRLNEIGAAAYPSLLRDAATSHDESWLAEAIRSRGFLREFEERRKPKGGVTMAKVPVTAADTLAEGEFNRFYCRGVCSCAIEDTVEHVFVYRAKPVQTPRPESEARIGATVAAQTLLSDLRTSIGVEPALGVPPGPNSGLSVKLR